MSPTQNLKKLFAPATSSFPASTVTLFRCNLKRMKKSTKIILGATTVFLLAFALFGVERWATSRAFSLEEMLKLLVQDMPADTTGVVYIDVSQMRQSPFLQKVFTWAQKPQTDAEYAQFVSDTGFNYERDLNRVA